MARLANRLLANQTAVDASGDTGDIRNSQIDGAVGGHFVVTTSNKSGTPSLTFTIQGKEEQTGAYYTLLAGSAVTNAETNVYTVFPGGPASPNVSANNFLPAVYRVIWVYSGTGSMDVQVGVNLLG